MLYDALLLVDTVRALVRIKSELFYRETPALCGEFSHPPQGFRNLDLQALHGIVCFFQFRVDLLELVIFLEDSSCAHCQMPGTQGIGAHATSCRLSYEFEDFIIEVFLGHCEELVDEFS